MDSALKMIRDIRDKDATLTPEQRYKKDKEALKRFAERTGRPIVLVDPSEVAAKCATNLKRKRA